MSNIWMDFVLHDLGVNVRDARIVVYDAAGTKLREVRAFTGPNAFGNIPMHVVIQATELPDTTSSVYGNWKVNVSLRLTDVTTNFGWVFARSFNFAVTFTGQPPPPPPPPCTTCPPGQHCEGGICVPDPPPPPPEPQPQPLPTWVKIAGGLAFAYLFGAHR